MKNKLCLVVISILFLATSYAGSSNQEKPYNKFSLFLEQLPEGKAGAVSVVGRDWNIADDHFFNNNFMLINQAGIKGTFFCNSILVDSFKNQPDNFVFWDRLRQYVDSGQEIGLMVTIDDISNIENVIYVVNNCSNILKKKLGIDLKTLTFRSQHFLQRPIVLDKKLEEMGYFLDNYDYYRTLYMSPDMIGNRPMPIMPEEIGEEAEFNSLWMRTQLPVKSAEAISYSSPRACF